MKIYACDKCGFLFQRVDEVSACPLCGSMWVRPATETETARLEKEISRNSCVPHSGSAAL